MKEVVKMDSCVKQVSGDVKQIDKMKILDGSWSQFDVIPFSANCSSNPLQLSISGPFLLIVIMIL